MRRRLELPRELWIQNFGGSWCRSAHCQAPYLYASTDGSRRACGVGACTCIVPTLIDPRETPAPRIDRFRLVRPPWTVAASSPRIQKCFCRPPGSVPLISLDQYRTEGSPNTCDWSANAGSGRTCKTYRRHRDAKTTAETAPRRATRPLRGQQPARSENRAFVAQSQRFAIQPHQERQLERRETKLRRCNISQW